MVARGWRDGAIGKGLLTEYEGFFWGDEKILEIDSGDGCTTL